MSGARLNYSWRWAECAVISQTSFFLILLFSFFIIVSQEVIAILGATFL